MPTAVFPATPVVFAQVTMNGNVAAGGSSVRPAVFVFNYKRTNPALAVSKSQVDAAFQTAIATPIAAGLNARYLQSYNAVRWANDAFDQPVQFSHALPGLVAGDSMSTAIAAYLLFRTGIRGRSFRGSKHLFPMSEGDTTAGTDDILNAAALARMATVAAAILAGFTDAGGNVWVPQVLSTRLSQQRVNPNTITSNDLTSVLVAKRLGTMRHRKVKPQY